MATFNGGMDVEEEVIELRLAIAKLGLIFATFQMMPLIIGQFMRHVGVTPAGEHHHVGAKPLNSILYMSLALCVSTLAWWTIGAPFAFGNGGENRNWMVGLRGWLLEFQKQPCAETMMIQGPMCSIARWFHEWATAMFVVTIFASVVAGRCSSTGFIILMASMAGGIYPIVAHWIWSEEGLLSPFYDNTHKWDRYQHGVMDVAGSGVIHITAGACSLMATLILRNPYKPGGEHRPISSEEATEESPEQAISDEPGPSSKRTIQSDPTLIELESGSRPHHDVGMLLMWFGWFGLTCGRLIIQHSTYEAIARASVTSSLAAAAGGLISFVIYEGYVTLPEFIRGPVRRGDARTATSAGILAGLVTISACAATCEPYVAALIGAVGGFCAAITRTFIPRCHDPTDAIAIHLVPGIVGLIAAGLVATKTYTKEVNYATGMNYGAIPGGGGDLLVSNLVGMCAILAWSIGASGTLCLLIRAMEEGSRLTRHRWQNSTIGQNWGSFMTRTGATPADRLDDEEVGEEHPTASLAPAVEPPPGEPVMSGLQH